MFQKQELCATTYGVSFLLVICFLQQYYLFNIMILFIFSTNLCSSSNSLIWY